MTAYFRSLRAKSRIIDRFAAWQEGYTYPFFYALLCALSGLCDHRVYLPVVVLQMVLFLFAVLFVKDKRAFLVPVFMAFYSLGCDNEAFMTDQRDSLVGVFDPTALAAIIIMGSIMFLALVARLCLDGSIRAVFHRRPPMLGGILLFAAAFMLNGAFSVTRTTMDTVYGLLFALGFIVFYVLISSLLQCSEKPTVYACVCMVATAWMVLLQLLILVLHLRANGLLWVETVDSSSRLARELIWLPWGYATNIGGIQILGIPPAIYLARNARFSPLSFVSAACFLGGALLTGSRGAIFGGLAILIVCLIFACFGGKNSKLVRLYTLICLLLGVLALLYLNRNVRSISEIWERVSELLRLDIEGFSDSARLTLWRNGIEDFLSAPIFGVGFSDGGYLAPPALSSVFNDMYHNLPIECAGAMGVLGIFALLYHCKDLACLTLRRFSANKLILIMLPAAVLITSLVDNFFFYLNFQIFYCAFLALAEKESPAAPLPLAQNQ